MGQALLISNNEVVNSLYEVNLRAYVAVSVTVKETVKSATLLLDQNLTVDAIIAVSENQSDLDFLLAYIKEKKLTVPLIVLGNTSVKSNNTECINNKYDIRGLLRTMAKILEVTAAEMASRAVAKYFPIPIGLLSTMEKSHCDIYNRIRKVGDLEYDYFKILDKDSPVDEIVQKYSNEGASSLFIDASERLRFINRASGLVIEELQKGNLSTEDRVTVTAQAIGLIAENLFENPQISQEVANISQACINSIGTVVQNTSKANDLLKMLVTHKDNFIYMHSVLATYIASGILKNIPWGSIEQIEKVSFALFFHDIFLVPISLKYPNLTDEEELLYNDEIEEKDKEVIIEHAKLAAQLVQTFPDAPMGVDTIIKQHHGMSNGQGFAVTFKDDISPLAKVMIIAEDVATDILTKVKQQDEVIQDFFNKKQIMERLYETYDKQTYKKIIEAFEHVKLQ